MKALIVVRRLGTLETAAEEARAGAFLNGCLVLTDGCRFSIMPATYYIDLLVSSEPRSSIECKFSASSPAQSAVFLLLFIPVFKLT